MTNHNEQNYIYQRKEVENRWDNHVNPELRFDPWTEEEDNVLISMDNEIDKKIGVKW